MLAAAFFGGGDAPLAGGEEWNSLAPAPLARTEVGEETAGTIREVELFDPRTRRWRRLADLPTPRHGLGVVARRGRVYAIAGGDAPGFAFTSAVEALRVGG